MRASLGRIISLYKAQTQDKPHRSRDEGLCSWCLSRASGSASSWKIRLGVLQLRIGLAANSRPRQAIRQTSRSTSLSVVQTAVGSLRTWVGCRVIFFYSRTVEAPCRPYMTHSSTTECSSGALWRSKSTMDRQVAVVITPGCALSSTP